MADDYNLRQQDTCLNNYQYRFVTKNLAFLIRIVSVYKSLDNYWYFL